MQEGASADAVLVVDLDGTLIRSDMLFETFWAAFAVDWRAPLRALIELGRGRAALKRGLARAAAGGFDPADLPYNDNVIAYVTDWRARGGRTALVTAADGQIAARIAAHLGLFDEVHGSDGVNNLKGPAKAAFLTQRFGKGGFSYLGDSAADVAIWSQAAQAITLTPSPALRHRAEAASPGAEHLAAPRPGWRPFAEAMRPHQWLKNFLVFLPMLADQRFDAATLLSGVLAFLAFGLVASSVYVQNDLLDLAPDRAHPRKRARPFASGRLAMVHGFWMIPALLGAGLIISLTLGWLFVLIMLCYYITTLVYSLWLKRLIILDICVLAVLYTLRIAAGGAAAGVALSVWLLAFSIFFFFALAAVKRQAELVDAGERDAVKRNGRGYGIGDAPLVAQMATSSGYVSVLVLALYLNAPEVQAQYSAPSLLWGVCLVLLYWISRMVLRAHRGQMHDDPVVFAARDRVSLLCLGLIVALVAGAVVL